MPQANAGYFRSGLPYNRFGHGPRPLVVFQGLMFENKPQSGLVMQMYNFLRADYTTYSVLRKPGLPRGYALADMADDYAVMIREEFGGPVDVLGVSTGGSIVQHFAADHPDLVRRLVIHSSAHRLSDAAKAAQLEVARLADQRRWREAWAVLLRFMLGPSPLARAQAGLAATVLSVSKPADPSDLVITILAEDLRRDIIAPMRWFLWLGTTPKEIRPGLTTSLNASYTPAELRELVKGTQLAFCMVSSNLIGLTLFGNKPNQ